MKVRVWLCVFVIATVTPGFAGEKPGDAKDIQGTWLPVKAELGGQSMGDGFVNGTVLTLRDGQYAVAAESVDKGTYTLDPATKPGRMDIAGLEGPNAGKRIAAIYELQGDTLQVCYGLGGGPRPAEFKSPAGTKVLLVTYKRKKV